LSGDAEEKPMNPTAIGMVLFLALSVLVAADLWLWLRIYATLKAEHPSVWERLGRPALLKARAIDDVFPMHRFVWRREHVILGSANLDRAVNMLRVVEVLSVIVLLVYGLFYCWIR
jgi:hypothetical protein